MDPLDYPPEVAQDPLHVMGVSFAAMSPEPAAASPLELLMETLAR